CEARQHASFALETLDTAAAEARRVEELDCCLAFEAAVAAMREPYEGHAAVADLALERVVADNIARIVQVSERGFFKERGILGRGLLLQQRFELVGQRSVITADLCQPLAAARAIGLEQLIEQRAKNCPALTIETRHRPLLRKPQTIGARRHTDNWIFRLHSRE